MIMVSVHFIVFQQGPVVLHQMFFWTLVNLHKRNHVVSIGINCNSIGLVVCVFKYL